MKNHQENNCKMGYWFLSRLVKRHFIFKINLGRWFKVRSNKYKMHADEPS